MSRKRSTPPKKLTHQWYLAEWAHQAQKKQADAVRELGWSKASASALWNNEQRYTQDLIDEAAIWLHVKPYELLLTPAEAMAIRQLRAAVAALADDRRETVVDIWKDQPSPIRKVK